MGRMFRFGKCLMRERELNLILDITLLIGKRSKNSYFVGWLLTLHVMNWTHRPETVLAH
jgi:hypothetical protein